VAFPGPGVECCESLSRNWNGQKERATRYDYLKFVTVLDEVKTRMLVSDPKNDLFVRHGVELYFFGLLISKGLKLALTCSIGGNFGGVRMGLILTPYVWLIVSIYGPEPVTRKSSVNSGFSGFLGDPINVRYGGSRLILLPQQLIFLAAYYYVNS
jgi:hypothetical protein